MDLKALIQNLSSLQESFMNEPDAQNNDLSKHLSYLSNCIKLLNDFNNTNEITFSFNQSSLTQTSDLNNLSHSFRKILSYSWSHIVKSLPNYMKTIEGETFFTHNSNLIVACLNTIRLLSRDQNVIHMFENESIQNLIQKIANLCIIDPTSSNSSELNLHSLTPNQEIDSIVLSALKSVSNLIYNSKFIQDFYIKNGAAETITISLKQFNPVDSFNTTTTSSTSSPHGRTSHSRINIMLFNLRILFLLTALNKDLRSKLREKLQVITYLIEIIDQIMKERLNEGIAQLSSELASFSAYGDHTSQNTTTTIDFCYLKSIDIDLINEILKILYNLTIDITSNNASCLPLGQTFCVRTANNEEDEAHLMHLVSVLRDLITCRLEDEHDMIKSTQKLKILHSNIVNLLTNMPNICYEELMAPSLSSDNNNTNGSNGYSNGPSNNLFKQINNYSLRLAHNKKRQLRGSKRIKKRESKRGKSLNSKIH
jgi:hypothetical protein